MAFTNRVYSTSSGFGTAGYIAKQEGNSITGTSADSTTTLTSISPTISKGRIRIKGTYTSGTSVTSQVTLKASDGTTTLVIAQYPAISLSSNNGFDIAHDFCVDLALTSVTATITQGGTSPVCSYDFEVFGSK